jgi:Mn2+/Fe2+ NRAMP family transporter
MGIKKDIGSISVMIALLGAILGGLPIWLHSSIVENDIDY